MLFSLFKHIQKRLLKGLPFPGKILLIFGIIFVKLYKVICKLFRSQKIGNVDKTMFARRIFINIRCAKIDRDASGNERVKEFFGHRVSGNRILKGQTKFICRSVVPTASSNFDTTNEKMYALSLPDSVTYSTSPYNCLTGNIARCDEKNGS